MKTGYDFQLAAHRIAHHNNILVIRWPYRNCVICKAPLSIVIYLLTDQVFFDPNCECILNHKDELEQRDWHHIADIYNAQTHPHVIAEMNAFWGFDHAG